jgi:hypothetical protein
LQQKRGIIVSPGGDQSHYGRWRVSIFVLVRHFGTFCGFGGASREH